MEYKFIKTDYLEMVAGGDSDLLKELIGMFRDQVAEFNSEMNVLYGEGNYHALGKSCSQSQIVSCHNGNG